MRIQEALSWRYRTYIEPYRVLTGNLASLVRRSFNNWNAARSSSPIAFVYANPTNAGDYASHLGLKLLANRQGMELFCDPVAVPKTLKIIQSRPQRKNTWKAVFVGGGGLLQRCFDPFWEGLLNTDVPFILFGVGANSSGSHRETTREDLLAGIAKRARAIHVRDRFTLSLLAPFAADRITVGICPSVHYLANGVSGHSVTSTHLLHVMHEVDLRMSGASPEMIREKLKAIARHIGLRYAEVNHMHGVNRSLINQYKRAAVVVSSRLHGCIFSYALRKPFVAIECDRKVSAFLETFVKDTHLISAASAERELSEPRLKQVMADHTAAPLEQLFSANQQRMSEILASLEIPDLRGFGVTKKN